MVLIARIQLGRLGYHSTCYVVSHFSYAISISRSASSCCFVPTAGPECFSDEVDMQRDATPLSWWRAIFTLEHLISPKIPIVPARKSDILHSTWRMENRRAANKRSSTQGMNKTGLKTILTPNIFLGNLFGENTTESSDKGFKIAPFVSLNRRKQSHGIPGLGTEPAVRLYSQHNMHTYKSGVVILALATFPVTQAFAFVGAPSGINLDQTLVLCSVREQGVDISDIRLLLKIHFQHFMNLISLVKVFDSQHRWSAFLLSCR